MEKNIISKIKYIHENDSSLVNSTIAKIILDNIDLFPKISIIQISKKANVSKSSITKFCKKLNLLGFKELVFTINEIKKSNKVFVSESISEIELIKKYFNKINKDINFSFNENINSIINASKIIKNAKKVFLFGKGANLDVIRIFANYLIKLKINNIYF